MPTYQVQLNVQGTREEIREQVIMAFLAEFPGNGKGDMATRYIYKVETTKIGEHVLLHRPAALNKGMDFTVHVSETRFLSGKRNLSNPSHKNIIDDLIKKKNENGIDLNILFNFITDIYLCKNINFNTLKLPTFLQGIDTELILKVIKWLFIEQDITYWNWSGRHMFYSKILEMLQPHV